MNILEQKSKEKHRSSKRGIVLNVVDNKKPKSSTGLIDPKLFSGDTPNLFINKDLRTSLWQFKYDAGFLPEALRNRFTSFDKAKQHAERYFKTRNLKIKQVID